jgi:hypothetical protein
MNLLKLHPRIDNPMDLQETAASTAAATLAENWSGALKSGVPIAKLVDDVDRVTMYLGQWAESTKIFIESGLDYEALAWANSQISELTAKDAYGRIEYQDGIHEVQITVKKDRSISVDIFDFEAKQYDYLLSVAVRKILFAE